VDVVDAEQVCTDTCLIKTINICTMTKEDAAFVADFKLTAKRCAAGFGGRAGEGPLCAPGARPLSIARRRPPPGYLHRQPLSKTL